MSDNDVVTKGFLKDELKKEFAKFHKKLKNEDFVQLRKDINHDLAEFVEGSIAPLFDKMDKRFDKMDKRFDKMDKRFDKVDKNIEELKFTVDTHERRLDRHDDKFLAHQKLTA